MKRATQTRKRNKAQAPRLPRDLPSDGGAWKPLRAERIEILQAREFAALPWLVHGFSTRAGGASLLPHPGGRSGDQSALNLGFTDWDKPENVLANRAQLLTVLDAEKMTLVTLRQVHSDVIYALDEPPASVLSGDAAITRTRGLLLGVQTADCVPILLADTRIRAVAAVHAGWRGTLRRIAAKTLGHMQMVCGTRPADVLAAIGPAISQCCYEVGLEVAQAYAGQFANAREWFDGPFEQLAAGEEPNPFKWLSMAPPGHDPPPRVRLDLVAANRWQLLDAGVKPANIAASELCTSCRTDVLFSYRREGARTGRMLAGIGVRANA